MNDESTPKGAPEALGGDSLIVSSTDVPNGLTPRKAWEAYLEAYMRGYADGIDRGRREAEEELASIQRTAAEVVHHMAELPVRDAQADQTAADRRSSRWSR